MLETKLDELRRILQGFESCLVAYSGGVDSVLLAFLAHQTLGEKALAVIADSPSLPRRELEEGIEIARQFRIPLRVVQTEEFDNASYVANPANRCYFCKQELFLKLRPMAVREGYKVIAYGENASDMGDFRPGATAAAEFEVRAPLKEAGLSKDEIRELSARYGLPTAEKPQLACLSSRIPHGERVDVEKLGMIEQAEYLLRDLGFFEVRVRHHELSHGHLARIELGAKELRRLFEENLHEQLADQMRQAGYRHVTVDLEGYKRGGGNGPLRVESGQAKG